MRIDFFKSAVERCIAGSKQAKTPALEAIAKEVVLDTEDLHWPDLLRGSDLNFGFACGTGFEKFFVGHDWTADADDSGWYSGGDWPPHRWASQSKPGVVVRSVGRGAKYLALVAGDFEALSTKAPWIASGHRFIADAAVANTRSRKVRATKYLPSLGSHATGIELQQEHTLVARSGDGFPLAVWTLGVSLFFPNARPPAVEDFVPVLTVTVLSAWEARNAWPPELDQAFSSSLCRVVLRSLNHVGPYLTSSVEFQERFDDAYIDLPFAIKIALLPSMLEQVPKVVGAFAQLFDQSGHCEALTDSHAVMWWIDVDVAEEDVAAKRATSKAVETKALEEKGVSGFKCVGLYGAPC